MKITAKTTDQNIISLLTEKFWMMFCKEDIKVYYDGFLRRRRHHNDSLNFFFSNEDTENPSWSVVGRSCKGNKMSVSCDNSVSPPIIEVQADTTRHALRDSGNMAGFVFYSMFFEQSNDDNEDIKSILTENILESLDVTEYDSWRKDVPWWESGLHAEPKKGDGWQVI